MRCNVRYYCSTGWMASFTLCDVGSSGNCHSLCATGVLAVCWPRAFTEQPTHLNRIGWAQVIQLYWHRQKNWYLHLWTLLILSDACLEPHHFTRGYELHCVTTEEWYKAQEVVLETEHVPFTGSTINNQKAINLQTVVSEILNKAQKKCSLLLSHSHLTEVEQDHYSFNFYKSATTMTFQSFWLQSCQIKLRAWY